MLHLTNKIIEFENGEMEDEEVGHFFQELIDTELLWHLQGTYQRIARTLVDAGVCHWQGNRKEKLIPRRS